MYCYNISVSGEAAASWSCSSCGEYLFHSIWLKNKKKTCTSRVGSYIDRTVSMSRVGNYIDRTVSSDKEIL